MKIRNITLCAMFAALITVGAQIWFPLPITQVPVTLQTLCVYLVALLGEKKVVAGSLIAYLTLGAFGLPVFSGFSGGMGIIMGPTGGYLLGFIPGALAATFLGRSKGIKIMAMKIMITTFFIYLLGSIQLKLVADMTFKAALMTGVLPFILGDFIKGVISCVIAKRINI